MASCKQKGCRYYDIELLSKSVTPSDVSVRDLHAIYSYKVRDLTVPSKFWKQFNIVTPDLIQEFRSHAVRHVRSLKENGGSYFFRLVAHQLKLFNYIQFDYQQFPLVDEKWTVMKAIRAIAKEIPSENEPEFDATCLHLLYFYGVLANPHSNWITMDYLTSGNRYHAYGTRWSSDGMMFERSSGGGRCRQCA